MIAVEEEGCGRKVCTRGPDEAKRRGNGKRSQRHGHWQPPEGRKKRMWGRNQRMGKSLKGIMDEIARRGKSGSTCSRNGAA
jgi:hypothetical protein